MRPAEGAVPLKIAQTVLRALLDPRYRDTIMGDLLEEYRERIIQNERTATRWYIRQVLSFVNCASVARALLPGCLGWTLAAAVTELVFLLGLPIVGRLSPDDWFWFSFAAFLLASASACAMRSALGGAIVLRTSIVWMLPFFAAALPVLELPLFNPIPGVAAFFVCTTGAALYSGQRTGKLIPGIAAATLTGGFIVTFTAIVTALLRLTHPPLASLPLVLGIAASMGAIGGSFGKRFGRFSQHEPERLLIT